MKYLRFSNLLKSAFVTMVCAVAVLLAQGCSDDPAAEHYYTFTGETMSDYINSRPQYSHFAYIVKQAGLNDLLSSYGHYTCFLPDNEAVKTYLKEKGIGSIEKLSKNECDTLARTHLVGNIYTTNSMNDGTLNTANMNNRYIQITHGLDSASNSVVFLNRSAYIIYAEQDDSVVNGIVQPVNKVLEMTNSSLGDILRTNQRVSMFYQALQATGLIDTLYKVRDDSYDGALYGYQEYSSHNHPEVAVAPDEKKYGFTAFIEPNDVYLRTLTENGIDVDTTSAKSVLGALYKLALKLYEPTYGNDEDFKQANKDDNKENYSHRWNALNMFVAYHILNRDCIGWNLLTPRELSGFPSPYNTTAIMIKKNLMNPCDWYETLLPRTMMKIEQATVYGDLDGDTQYDRYINRRVKLDDNIRVHGACISPTIESNYVQDGPNGRYFYINKVIAFDYDTQNIVFNDNIRMDMSTIFPELMTMNIRLNGDPTKDDGSRDYTFANGKNYYFPQGFLDNVNIQGGFFVYRRPHWNFDCYEGDEMNLIGDGYDITFRLPPVPFEGDYQIRLGAAFIETRGIAQIYFDGKPQGIPIDMTKNLQDILGTKWTSNWVGMSDDDKAADQKILKNLGYYRGPYGAIHQNNSEFVNSKYTFRKVLCTVHINPKTDHYLRIRSTSSQGTEFMLDYLELVPKSVYDVMAGKMESPL